jgi:integrase
MDKLTALGVKRQNKPGRYGDGGGLWLQVRDADHKSWLFRYTSTSRRQRQMGLGSLETVSLAEARDAALAARKQVEAGVDPIEAKQQKAVEESQRNRSTYQEVAELYIAAHKAGWKNPKHAWQWDATLKAHVFPVFGGKLVAAVDTGDVMRALEPIWHKIPETASRLRGRIEVILDYAKARDWREGENPARWRGHIRNLLPIRDKIQKVQHHPALPWGEIGAFMVDLRDEKGTAARAVEFVILTAARTNEAFLATWGEVDLRTKIWRVGALRMKGGVDHSVPLCAAAVELLNGLRPENPDGGALIFPAKREGKPLSNMAGTMLLRRMKRGDITVHGFRSTFRDWAADATNHPREVAEAALAHILENKVEAAYRRSELLAKRASLMEDWGRFCAEPVVRQAEVVTLQAVRT